MELYSEADVVSKVVVRRLAELGYVEGNTPNGRVVVRHEYPITAQSGREKKTIFADIVVFVGDVPVIVVDAKNPREFMTDNDREQVVSYARLLDKIAPYAAICNGSWQIFDAIRKQEIKALPRIGDLLSDLQGRRLTTGQQVALRSQANRTLLAIDSARDLSRLMRRCHDTIRNLKGYDPTKAFDELSKVLFAKMFEERELNEGRRKRNRFTLESVRDLREEGVEIIQELWKATVSSDRYREVFSDEATDPGIDLPPEAVDKIVALLEDKSLVLTDMDVKGVAFEEFLSVTYRGGGLGQYFTPRAVVNFMVDLVEPAIGERVTDPSCGSGGFLIRVYDVCSEKIKISDLSEREKARRLAELANQCLVGIDWEQRAARTCKMNMILHGDGHAGVYQANALDIDELKQKVKDRRRFYPNAPAIEEGTFDVVLSNPPFGAHDDLPRILKHYELGKGKRQKRETLLLERQIRLLRPGGRIAVVIPEGVLSNKTRDRKLREYILRECVVKAVIRLPQDTFKKSEGAACTSILYAVKKNPDDPKARDQGNVFLARAEYIGIAPSGKPIPENDLLAIREQYRRFERGEWDGIEMEPTSNGGMRFIREQPSDDEMLWLEPSVNRTSLLLDRLSYVLRNPHITDRFSYTYFHPEYYRLMNILEDLSVPTTITTMNELCQSGAEIVSLDDLCTAGYPCRGRKPSEESVEGIAILKVRNVTPHGVNLDTDFAPDDEKTRVECARALIHADDLLITSTGEGTIGRVAAYPYVEPAIADGHVSIVRLRPEVNARYVAEFLRSEHGQVQMLRFVSGSTGQTELPIEHIRDLRVPMPSPAVQEKIVEQMAEARMIDNEFRKKAADLCAEGAIAIAHAQNELMRRLGSSSSSARRDNID